MEAFKTTSGRLGVQFDSTASLIAVSTVLILGAYTILKPIFSFIRALFSLFILPGKSVRTPSLAPLPT